MWQFYLSKSYIAQSEEQIWTSFPKRMFKRRQGTIPSCICPWLIRVTHLEATPLHAVKVAYLSFPANSLLYSACPWPEKGERQWDEMKVCGWFYRALQEVFGWWTSSESEVLALTVSLYCTSGTTWKVLLHILLHTNTEFVLTPSMVNSVDFMFILLNSLCKFRFKWCLFRNITLTVGSWKCNLSYLNSYGPLFNNSMTHYIFMCFMFICFHNFLINLGGEILGNKLYTWITLVFPTVPSILLEWNHSYYV